MRKSQVLTALGRRTKGDIIDDVVRPSPAQTVSFTPPSFTGGSGDGTPDCTNLIPDATTPCGDLTDTFNRNIAIGWGGTSGGLQWHWHNYAEINTYAEDEGVYFVTTNYGLPLTAYVGGSGGTLEALPYGSNNSYVGAVVTSPLPYNDVAEPVSVLFTLYWSELGDTADNTTQHDMRFGVRGADIPSGTADAIVANLGIAPWSADAYWSMYWQVRLVWKEFPARVLPDSYIEVGGTNATTTVFAVPNIIANVDYKLRLSADHSGTRASWWRASDGEETAVIATSSEVTTAYGRLPPYLTVALARNAPPSFAPNDKMRAKVHFRSIVVNEIPGGAPSDCSDSLNPGFYRYTLYNVQNYWRTQQTEVTFGQVWFDGIAVTEGVHYNIVDGYKIVPTTILDVDTVVEAEVTVNA